MEATEVIEVRLMDSSTFAFARELMKLEILPPGQEDTSIIPSAMDGLGFVIIISKYVNKGSSIN